MLIRFNGPWASWPAGDSVTVGTRSGEGEQAVDLDDDEDGAALLGHATDEGEDPCAPQGQGEEQHLTRQEPDG
jgi:hypothetical protein